MAKNFRVSFDIPESKLATIVSLISGEVGNLVIRDTATIANNTSPPVSDKGKHHSAPRPRGKTAIGVVHEALSKHKLGDEVSYPTIKNILRENGYNANSHSSIISQMVAHGFVERTKPETLKILKAFA